MSGTQYYIGLMSGTSLDGIDAVIADFSQSVPQLVASHAHAIPESLQKQLIDTIESDWCGSLTDIGRLNQQLGSLFADAVKQLLLKSNIPQHDIMAIGSHGQTLWHQPQGDFPFSMQLGDANLITELTGITTVADFRGRDIAAGGEGAPLVPAFHHEYLSDSRVNRMILNIGGIANLSLLPSRQSRKYPSGFDTGPGNGLIDAWISDQQNTHYDRDGNWGRSGNKQKKLLDTLLQEPYFHCSPPKSTGKERFNLKWLKTRSGHLLHHYKPEDVQATLTELTARTIADAIHSYGNERYSELFVCGGGVHNLYLMERLKKNLKGIRVAPSSQLGIDPDWMEALAFAWLAKQTLHGKTGNLPSVTGAKGTRILGAIYQR